MYIRVTVWDHMHVRVVPEETIGADSLELKFHVVVGQLAWVLGIGIAFWPLQGQYMLLFTEPCCQVSFEFNIMKENS